MLQKYWLNLAVLDEENTLDFYEKLGVKVTRKTEGRPSAIHFDGQVICLYATDYIESYMKNKINTSALGDGVLISFSMKSNEDVDDFYEKLLEQDANVLVVPSMNNGYYGMMFEDINGYKMNIIVMGG